VDKVVRPEELNELHYITPIVNVLSILQSGILSHRRTAHMPHVSVALTEVQERRAQVNVPGGRTLHEYVNLYIYARNPMLYSLQSRHADLCVLQVSTEVLHLPDVVITDGNASSDYIRFAPAPGGLHIVDRELTFAEYWTDPDPIQYFRKKSAKCAEVLVPDRIEPRFIQGAYVASQVSYDRLNSLGVGIAVTINRHLFFR
jgi:hypothetical protein